MNRRTEDYRTIRKNKLFYADKTPFIPELEKAGLVNVFLRPPGFGKSLTTSVLSCYYDANQKDDFDFLFSNTYIGAHKTAEANGYNILLFNLSGIDSSKDCAESDFNRCVNAGISGFVSRYMPGAKMVNSGKSAGTVLRSFLEDYRTKAAAPIYVMFDGYDRFADAARSDSPETTSFYGFLRCFFEVLKDYCGGAVGRLFITGTAPFAPDGLISGFDNAKNISGALALHNMTGFTESEVAALLRVRHIDPDDIMPVLREVSGGYRFHPEAETPVYMPDMVLCRADLLVKKPSVDIILERDLMKISELFSLYENKEVFESIVRKETLSGVFRSKFERNAVHDRSDFLSMLFYWGLLTIAGSRGEEILFAAPNESVVNAFRKYSIIGEGI